MRPSTCITAFQSAWHDLPSGLRLRVQDGAQLFESYTRFHFCFIPLCKVI